MKPPARTVWTLWACLSVFLLATFASGQQRDEYGEIRQTVARISYFSGEVSFSRGDDPDDWQPADRNVPMTLGDRIYTGSRSRLELQLHGGNSIRLGARTDLAALNLTDDTNQFSIRAGIASFQIRRLFEDELFEVDTPNAAVTFDRPGEYRVDVDEHANTRVSVRRGSATVAAGGGQIPVNEGEAIDLEGLDSPRYDIVSLSRPDGWDQWVGERVGRLEHARSYQYVSADVVGADDLDEYGRWEDVPQYGRVWSPTAVAVDWAPYRVGHWIWQDPWGWTWVSAEPWGWAPYHYGRWVVVSSRWYWVPVAPRERFVSYSPALVAFVGGGPGWSASFSIGGGGVVGWFPLGPRDPFLPWWGLRAHTRVSAVTNVTYVNRTYVTVVNQNTFVSGGIVTTSYLRDRAVVNQVVAAPVLRGPVPIVPTAASLRMAVRTDAVAAARPPAAVSTRQVVARVAPPPAPPTFRAKLAVITENQGAPVAPAVAARISVENRGRPQSVTTVRPAAEAGQVQLAPRAGSTETRGERKPEPVTAFRGRPMATTQQPVAASPVTGSTAPSSTGASPREIAPRPERQAAPTPVPGRSLGQPGESGRPQPEESRGRVRPTEGPSGQPPSTLERRSVGAPPATQAPQPIIERRREQPTAPPAAQPRQIERQREQPTAPPAAQPRSIERRQEQPTAPPAAQPRQIERRQEKPTAPPAAQPQQIERRREQPTAPPAGQPPGQPPAIQERGRERPTAPPPQGSAPAPEKQREAGQPAKPSPPARGQSAERPPAQRGRPVTPKPEETKKPD